MTNQLPFPSQYFGELQTGHSIYNNPGDPREYGVDLTMPRGTVIVAPTDGIVQGYTASGSGGLGPSDWYPGRLLFTDSVGNTLGFGHVISSVSPGTHVHAGDPIARIGPDPAEGDHLEFMIWKAGDPLTRALVHDPRPYLASLGFQPGGVSIAGQQFAGPGVTAVQTVGKTFSSIGDAIGWIFAPGRFWQLGMTLGGVLLIGVGVFMLMRDHAPTINITRDLAAVGA